MHTIRSFPAYTRACIMVMPHPRARVMSFSARQPARFPLQIPPHALRLQHHGTYIGCNQVHWHTLMNHDSIGRGQSFRRDQSPPESVGDIYPASEQRSSRLCVRIASPNSCFLNGNGYKSTKNLIRLYYITANFRVCACGRVMGLIALRCAKRHTLE
jgi:hypothetical protein